MPRPPLNPFAPFSRYLRRYRRALGIGGVCILGAQSLNVLNPLILERTIDAIIAHPHQPGWATNLVVRRFRDIQEHFSLISGRVQENLAGMRVVRAGVQEAGEVEDFRLTPDRRRP